MLSVKKYGDGRRPSELADPAVGLAWRMSTDEVGFRQMLDALPAAIYTTDAKGRITHFNPACVEFSGRTPTIGSDHWCVTWKLYHPDGRPMPHDECPMAVALKTGRIVRGAEAIAERPDGSRVWFTPYPTPLFDDKGNIIGGINMLLDITDRKQAEAASAKLAAIVESSDDAIISKDLNGIITSWNNAAQRLFGYAPQEMIGKPVTVLIPPDHVDEERGILDRIRRGQRVEHYDTVRRRKDGSLIDISLTVSPIKDAGGRVIGAAKVARDITQRKQAEKALRAGEERFRTLFELGPVAVYSCDASGVIREFNHRAAELWGRTPALGDTDERFCGSFKMIRPDGNVLAHEQCPMAEVLCGKIPHARDAEVVIERPDGSRVAVIVNIRPLKNERGQITGAINCFYDITERKQAEDRMRQARREAEAASCAKDKFLAVLSHELRTPLSPVLMTVAAMDMNPDLAPALREDVAMIRRNVELEAKLIDDLLDLSRVTAGKLRLNMEAVDVNSAVRHVCQTCRPFILEKGILLHCDLPDRASHVNADPARLQQILWNLLKNAAKFTPERGKIYLSVCAGGDNRVRIQVRDTGIGIAPDVLPRIFDAFEQGDASVTRQFGGMGLGLAISKALVEMHGGTISAQSGGHHRGSTFTVELPAVSPKNNADALPANRHNGNGHMGLRVLIVEDNADTARVLSRLLGASGHKVKTAASAAAALELADKEPFDVLVSDIGLPDVTGYDLMKQIKARYPMKGIAMSGYGMDEDLRKSREAGFSDHIVKPANVAQLERAIRRVSLGINDEW